MYETVVPTSHNYQRVKRHKITIFTEKILFTNLNIYYEHNQSFSKICGFCKSFNRKSWWKIRSITRVVVITFLGVLANDDYILT